jgi:hypothetical protein
MDKPEWRKIVGKLNASWPDQQISPETAAEWYDELAHLDPGDIWLAIRRLRTEQRWRPLLAEILAACKVQRQEIAEQVRHLELEATGRIRGTPMPPETRQAMEILRETLRPETTREQKAEARQMLDALAAQLARRCPVPDDDDEPIYA